MAIDLDSLHLRPLTDDEYAVFAARSMREFAEEVSDNTGITFEQAMQKATTVYADLLPDGLRSADQHLYAICSDDEQVGELWLGLRDIGGGALEAFGYDFWVRPELRDGGIGRRAMQLGAEEARALGAMRLALNVFGSNERAQHLYRSFGFEVTNVNMAMRLDDQPLSVASDAQG